MTSNAIFYTVEEVAAIMRVSKPVIYQMVKSGEMPSVKVGLRRVLIPCAVIDRLAEQWNLGVEEQQLS